MEKKDPRRPRAIAAICVAIAIIAASFALSSVLRLNSSGSMPVGLYIVRPSSGLARGAIVVACPPIEAQRVGLRYGYPPAPGFLPQSRCAGGSAPLLKYVIALAGDVVELNKRGLQINGKIVDAHKVARVDRDGRTLKKLSARRRRDLVVLASGCELGLALLRTAQPAGRFPYSGSTLDYQPDPGRSSVRSSQLIPKRATT